MVTGYDPSTASTPFSLPPAESFVRDLPQHVEQAISRATQVHPQRRFSSVRDLRDSLFPPTWVMPQQGAAPFTQRLSSSAGQGRGVWIGLGIAGLLLLGLCVLVAFSVIAKPDLLKAIVGQTTTLPPTETLSLTSTSAGLLTADLTPTTEVIVLTPTPLPPTIISLASPTPNLRILAQGVVEQFQNARATAYSTWNVDEYNHVLADGALASAIQTISQLEKADCRYYVSADKEMRFHYEEESATRIVIIASRSEMQRRVCAGSTSYTCYTFDGRYVVERRGDEWYIVEKSVHNLTENSPCP
jgi:hypothetical protein